MRNQRSSKSPYQNNIAWRILNASHTGRMYNHIYQVPDPMLKQISKAHGCKMPTRVRDLYCAFYALVQNKSDDPEPIRQSLYTITRKFCDMHNKDSYMINREAFIRFGGPPLLIYIIVLSEMNRNNGRSYSNVITNHCLSLLRELCYSHPIVGAFVWETIGDENANFLFKLMANKATFDNAVGLLEELLAFRETAIDISQVPNFNTLVTSLTPRQLTFFCRILALLVFNQDDHLCEEDEEEYDDMEGNETQKKEKFRKRSNVIMQKKDLKLHNHPLLDLTRDRNDGNVRTTDRNHAVILAVPGLLQRLVRLLYRIQKMKVTQDLAQALFDRISSGDISSILSTLTMADSRNEEEDDAWQVTAGIDMVTLSHPNGSNNNISVTVARLPVTNNNSAPARNLRGTFNTTNNNNNNTNFNRVNYAEELGEGEEDDEGDGEVVDSDDVEDGGDGDHNEYDETEDMSDNDEFNGVDGISLASQNIMSMIADRYLHLLTENIFVLCTLLDSKRRAEVQLRLVKSGLIPALNFLFDRIGPFHEESTNNMHTRRGSGEGSSRSTSNNHNHHHHHSEDEAAEGDRPYYDDLLDLQDAIRIQFLRLVHNFLSMDEYHIDAQTMTISSVHDILTERQKLRLDSTSVKRLFLSPDELRSMNVDTLNDVPAKYRCNGRRGLITKIVTAILQHSEDSCHRMWLISCIESFLRGSQPDNQLFVAKMGLMEYLIRDICKEGCDSTSTSLQNNLDVLGELLKFNRTLFLRFSDFLAKEKELHDKFFEIVNTRIIDSNVFLRSVLLSLDQFAAEDARLQQQQKQQQQQCSEKSATTTTTTTTTTRPLVPMAYPFAYCMLARYLEKERFHLARRLMTMITVESVTQENISCINTTMVLLICEMNKKQATLAQILETIEQEHKADEELAAVSPLLDQPPVSPCENFKKLLYFWDEYYSYRGRYRLSLEQSSRVPFSRWRSLVDEYHALTADLDERW